jgi:hypothetical protein
MYHHNSTEMCVFKLQARPVWTKSELPIYLQCKQIHRNISLNICPKEKPENWEQLNPCCPPLNVHSMAWQPYLIEHLKKFQ